MPLTLQQCKDGIKALEKFRVVELDQSNFFGADAAARLGQGICKAICLDWTRRKLFAGKSSYLVSKKTGDQALPLGQRLAKKGPRLAHAHQQINRAEQTGLAVVNELLTIGNKWRS